MCTCAFICLVMLVLCIRPSEEMKLKKMKIIHEEKVDGAVDGDWIFD